MDKDFKLYGVIGTKKDSWICCMKESNLSIEINEIFKKIINEKYREQETRKITKIPKYKNRYIYSKKHIEKGKKHYFIIFERTTHDEINPLYIKPYPCKNKQECNNIKALG